MSVERTPAVGPTPASLYDVPDFRQELRQLLVGHQLEVEALTRVVVAQGPEVGKDRQELGQSHHWLSPAIDLHVSLKKMAKFGFRIYGNFKTLKPFNQGPML